MEEQERRRLQEIRVKN